MPFNVSIEITEDSQRGQAIQRLAVAEHSTPEQIVERILDKGIRAYGNHAEVSADRVTPAEMLIGLFSSPENAALMDDVDRIATESRAPATSN